MLAVTHKKIPVILEEMLVYIGGEVNIAPFGESGSEGFGKAALEGLGTTNATILANHGILVCGKDMRLTVKAANLVEKVARIYWGALQIGDVHELEPEKQAKFIELFKGVASTANRPSKV
jgi:ribulose-5-phosphate 4-epimerase/fuculose-1-phosphate aldolase